MSDGFERSPRVSPLAISREQSAGQVQSIGSIEGGARVRKVFTTAREKELMVCPLPGDVPLNRSHHAAGCSMASRRSGLSPSERVVARWRLWRRGLDVPP